MQDKRKKPKPVGIRCMFYSETLHYNLNSSQNIQSSNTLSRNLKYEIKMKEVQKVVEIQWQEVRNEKYVNNKLTKYNQISKNGNKYTDHEEKNERY